MDVYYVALGHRFLLPMLQQAGRGDLAVQVLTQTSQPSWGWWVTQVLVIHAALLRFMCSLPCLAPQPLQNHATSLFEMWGAFHGLNKTGIASRNHIMFGSFLPWLWQGLGGLVS